MHISVNSGTKKSRESNAKHLDYYEHTQVLFKDTIGYTGYRMDLYEQLKDIPMEDHELYWFAYRFSDMYEHQCQKNIREGHSKRNVEIDKYMQSKIDKHVRESVFQVGDMFNNLGNEHMRNIYYAFVDKRNKYNEAHGINFQILDAVLNVDQDEATAHVHERGVFITKDENGNEVPEIEKALKEAGISIAYPDKPPKNRKEAKYNNRTITYTNEMRELFLTTAREYVAKHNLNVDLEDIKYTDPEARKSVRHKTVREYTKEKMSETAEEAQKTIENAQKQAIAIVNNAQEQARQIIIDAKSKADEENKQKQEAIAEIERQKQEELKEARRAKMLYIAKYEKQEQVEQNKQNMQERSERNSGIESRWAKIRENAGL